MKQLIFSLIMLILIPTAVVINTIVIGNEIDSTREKAEALVTDSEDALSVAEDIHLSFDKRKSYFSLTVDHEDLTNIEDCFAELIGNLKVGDADGAEIAKNRLISSLEHLRRLSGFNIDAFI